MLAGGKALRMGGEKPLRRLRGRTLLQHAIDLVAPLAGEVFVATGTRSMPLPAGVVAVPDPPGLEGRGPLSGILAGLEAGKRERCLVVPCDLPNLTAELLRGLLDELGQGVCVYCELPDGQEPLVVALDRERAAVAARDALTAGRNKVVPCWDSVGARVLAADWVAQFGKPENLYANINTMDDLAGQQGE